MTTKKASQLGYTGTEWSFGTYLYKHFIFANKNKAFFIYLFSSFK